MMGAFAVKVGGRVVQVEAGARAEDALAAAGLLGRDVVAARVDGVLRDLSTPLHDGAAVEPVDVREPEGLEVLRHSTAHVLAQAVVDLFPGAAYAIGPPVEDGFYYDFDLPRPLTEEDLGRIEARMREIISEDQPFRREELSPTQALSLFQGQPYKQEIIRSLDEGEGASGDRVSVYWNGRFVDLCRGPHLPSTGRIPAFRLLRVAGAYWRGDERNPMLQRVYGTAWPSVEELEAYLARLEEAARRDHRRLGRELDLFSIPEELGAGLVLWHPKGAIVRGEIESYLRQAHLRRGYLPVYTPHVGRAWLWETSGHLRFYRDLMYPGMDSGAGEYFVKPMNCPFHVLIYKSKTRSYRDLPLRLFELGTVYRFERSGVLHGLLRARGFTQDDSHIFCTREQLVGEILGVFEFALEVYRKFGFEGLQVALSTRAEKSIGTEEMWAEATETLRRALEKSGLPFTMAEGEGAFYGPKVDIHVRDAIGRFWQLTTVQVDFALPERFDLEYVGADNRRHRPVMVHRALLGSLERFFGVLIEHYAGAFPLWLAPVQAVVVPVASRHEEHARQVASRLASLGLRVEVDEARETVQAKIRRAQLAKVPYTLVVGDAEVATGTLSVRTREGQDLRGIPWEEFLARIREGLEGG